MIWPAAILKEQHPDWQIEIYRPDAVQVAVDHRGHLRAIQGLDLDGIDVLILQRVGKQVMLDLIREVQKRGTAVVLDADDALWAIHPDNAAYKSWNGGHQNWRIMDTAAKEADLVTVTTQKLAARYGKHGRVEIIPNRLPARALTASPTMPRDPDDQAVIFGWSGFVSTHPRDLHVIGDAAQRALTTNPTALARIIGAADGIAEAWDLTPDTAARVGATGGVDIGLYYGALSLLDIGLVPLETSAFNDAKSNLKAAEYSARGIPCICTPTPANRQLAAEGYPLLFAETPSEWFDHLHRLINDPVERAERGQEARVAADRHTMEKHAGEWATAWQRAAQRRTRLVGV